MQKKPKKFFKLEYLRKKYGFTQSEMASLLGVKQSSYSHKVNKTTSTTYDEMIIILTALNKKAVKAGDPLLTLDDIFLD